MQSASLPGSAGPPVIFLRTTFLSARSRFWARRIAISACAPGLDMLVEPQGESIAHHPGDEGRAGARAESLLGLAGELGVLELDRDDIGTALEDILGRELDPAREQVAKLTELPDGVREPLAQAVDVRAALRGGDQVDIALGDGLAVLDKPSEGPVHRLTQALQAP